MGDQLAISAYDQRNASGRTQAIVFINDPANCYDDSMIMENEASNINPDNTVKNDSTFNFLESTTH